MESITFSTLRRSVIAAAVAVVASSTGAAFAQIRITEVMSSSAATGVGTQDWFEATNYGSSPVDITGWKVDDSSFSSAVALALNGVTSIGPGESVMFTEIASTVAAGSESNEVANWRSFWGGAAATAQVGWYRGSGIGLSSAGDGIVLFDSANVEQTTRVSFGPATAGSSFYWGYRADGTFGGEGSATAGVVSTLGTLAGVNGGLSQTTYQSVQPPPAPFTVTNIASPGTAALVPEPSTMTLVAAGIGLAGFVARRRLRSEV